MSVCNGLDKRVWNHFQCVLIFRGEAKSVGRWLFNNTVNNGMNERSIGEIICEAFFQNALGIKSKAHDLSKDQMISKQLVSTSYQLVDKVQGQIELETTRRYIRHGLKDKVNLLC